LAFKHELSVDATDFFVRLL